MPLAAEALVPRGGPFDRGLPVAECGHGRRERRADVLGADPFGQPALAQIRQQILLGPGHRRDHAADVELLAELVNGVGGGDADLDHGLHVSTAASGLRARRRGRPAPDAGSSPRWRSTAKVIDAYRSQEYVEAAFRQAKDPHVVSFAPIRHFTDHKIRVHLFTCVLALAIGHLMRREATRAGLATSVPALLAELDGIGETVLLYQGERGRPRARHTITKMTPTQQRLYTIFGLDRYAPHR